MLGVTVMLWVWWSAAVLFFLLLKRGVGDDCTQRIDLSAARAVVRIDEAKCCFVMYKKTLIFQTKKRHMLSRARNSE
jgi:hypothetical protein